MPSRLQFLSVDILAQRLDRAALALNLPADLAGAGPPQAPPSGLNNSPHLRK